MPRFEIISFIGLTWKLLTVEIVDDVNNGAPLLLGASSDEELVI